MINYGLLRKEDASDPEKVSKAVSKFKEEYGADPTETGTPG